MRGVTPRLELCVKLCTFQLTRLMRGVTAEAGMIDRDYLRFQLTRLMRGVTKMK